MEPYLRHRRSAEVNPVTVSRPKPRLTGQHDGGADVRKQQEIIRSERPRHCVTFVDCLIVFNWLSGSGGSAGAGFCVFRDGLSGVDLGVLQFDMLVEAALGAASQLIYP